MAIDYIKRRSGRENEVVSRCVLDYGSIDLTGATACTDVLNAAFSHAARKNNVTIELPRGIYKITGPVSWPGLYPKIVGAGPQTVILADDTDYDWLTLGNGEAPDLDGSIGPGLAFARAFQLVGANLTPAPSGFKVGLKLNGVIGFRGEGLFIGGAPIGIDAINNCYISSFHDCNMDFDRNRIGIRLSGNRAGMDFASGNDWTFTNCRLHGRDAGVWVDNLGGGYHFVGGQIHAGTGGTPSDDRGNLVIGKDLETGTITGANQGMSFYGTSFENIQNGWGVRVYMVQAYPNAVHLLFDGVIFPGLSGAIGVMKITNSYDDTVQFNNCSVTGAYSATAPLSFDTATLGENCRASFHEYGTWGNATFASQPRRLTDLSMFMLGNVPWAHAKSGIFELKNQVLYRNLFLFSEQSTNWASNIANADFDGAGTWDSTQATWVAF